MWGRGARAATGEGEDDRTAMGKEEKTTSKGARPGMATRLHARVPRGQSLAGTAEHAGLGGAHGARGGSSDAVAGKGYTVAVAARLHARILHGWSLAWMGEHVGPGGARGGCGG